MLRKIPITHFIHPMAASALLVFGGILLFSISGRDDVFKTLWPAWTFAEYGTLVNYNGEALEQSSSLLQVLLIGFAQRLTAGNIVSLGGILAVLSGVATVIYGYLLAYRMGLRGPKLSWLPWLLGSSGFLVYWSWGGLDASLAAFCMVLFISGLWQARVHGKYWDLAGGALLFVMVRPENFLIAGMGLLGLWLWEIYAKHDKEPKGSSRILRAAGLTAIAMIAVMVFRWQVFGSIVPHTVMAKADGLSFYKLYQGLKYLFWESARHPEFLLLLFLSAWITVRGEKRFELRLILLFLLASGLFVLASGGDWMENGRFFVPIVPLLFVFLLLGLETFPAGLRKWLFPLLFIFNLGGLFLIARSHSTGQPLWEFAEQKELPTGYSIFESGNRVHARDIPAIAKIDSLVGAMRKSQSSESAHKITLLSQQAGMIIFHIAKRHYGHIRFIDLVGLCSRDFTDCEITANRGRTYGGLNMDLYYLFQDFDRISAECGFQKPDIIFDLDNERHEKETWLKEHGYKTVFRQNGWMKTGSEAFPGMEIGAWEIVMVRE